MYRSAGGIGAKSLFAANEPTLRGTAPPAGFGASRTVFTPKDSDANAQSLLIRMPEALRPLTLCNCDCKVITSALCVGLRKHSNGCVHPSQRCVAQRMMTGNVFEMETAAIALRTCYSEDPEFFSLTSRVLSPVWTTDGSSRSYREQVSRCHCRISFVVFVLIRIQSSNTLALVDSFVHHGLRPRLQMVNVSRSAA